ncbi:DUF2515 domain-containing protein [Paenibacillaceae bacterium]|nr:DUF2515 domain-containing protein [Paenibacillaceae bacterium]
MGWIARKLNSVLRWPEAVFRYWRLKRAGHAHSRKQLRSAKQLEFHHGAVRELADAWERKLHPPNLDAKGSPVAAFHLEAAAPLGDVQVAGTSRKAALSAQEQEWLAEIRAETQRCNRTNVTRTAAYLACYRRHPELHWALLAHMVSRNGGWNMTDLRGELLPRLLKTSQCESIFYMLERANALIFGDAYPQLLLYEQGKRLGKNLTHLLPELGVSRFMEPVWHDFWERQDAVLLSVSLIVNEQHYIEKRVVRHPFYQQQVLGTMLPAIQGLLQLNQVMFPYADQDGRRRLSGIILEHFDDLHERIAFGKQLYMMLFAIPEIKDGVYKFACSTSHTGSRADYADDIFTAVRTERQQERYDRRLRHGQLRTGAPPLYSPPLAAAWPEQRVLPAEPGDWYGSSTDVMSYFQQLTLPASFDLTHAFRFGLNKLETAVWAEQELGLGE